MSKEKKSFGQHLEKLATGQNRDSNPAGMTELFKIINEIHAQSLSTKDLYTEDENTHANNVYYNFAKLEHLFEELLSQTTNDSHQLLDLTNQQTLSKIEWLIESTRTVLSLMAVSSHGQKELLTLDKLMTACLQSNLAGPDERELALPQNRLERKLLLALIDAIRVLKDQIEQRNGENEKYTDLESTEQAEALSKMVVKRSKELLDPQEKVIYPGDIFEDTVAYDKVTSALEKMAHNSPYSKLVKLLIQSGTALFLMDPEIKKHFSHDEIKEFQLASFRTVANLSIGILDAIPAGVGEGASWGADIAKTLKRLTDKIRKNSNIISKIVPSWLDLTPDVSISEALLSEAMEPVTLGFIPSHLIFEFRTQFKHDCPRILKFLEKVALKKAELIDERNAYVYIEGLNSEKKLLSELQKAQTVINALPTKSNQTST